MKVLVTGASGLIGSALVSFLTDRGCTVVTLGRKAHPGGFVWNPAIGEIDTAALVGVDGVVHLAGANLAAGRWTADRRLEIRDSRVAGTRLLVEAIHRGESRPRVFVCASAIGIYGDTGDDEVDEQSEPGVGFLAGVCQEWEAEAGRASDLGIRVAIVRAGVVLSPEGGALRKLLPVFRAGLGGPIGGGRQWMSWVSIDDLVRIYDFALRDERVSGPFNAVTPRPVTNAEFAKTLGAILGRPAIAPVPATMLKLLYGAMAGETILASARVRPRKLETWAFQFNHPSLETALRDLLVE